MSSTKRQADAPPPNPPKPKHRRLDDPQLKMMDWIEILLSHGCELTDEEIFQKVQARVRDKTMSVENARIILQTCLRLHELSSKQFRALSNSLRPYFSQDQLINAVMLYLQYREKSMNEENASGLRRFGFVYSY